MKLLTFFAMLLFTSCALLPQAPETQIQKGALAHTAASNTATNLLRRQKITAPQARSYSNIMHTARDALNDANGHLVACRTATKSTSATTPDPCKANVAADINLFTSILLQVEQTLIEKEKQ